jgi:aryl-alcohol dehydrogenase-like predicted oxidoreductase
VLSRGIEAEILPTCRELGVGVTAYGVLSRGLLGGAWSRERAAAPGDIRARMPRFRPENLARNLALVAALRPIAEAKGATVAQLAIAWVLARGRDIVPLVGTTRRDRLAEAVDALRLELSEDDLAAVERAAPPGAAAGDRYDERQMAMLDSERSRPSQAETRA